jgi:hypothetical protein
LPVSRTSLHRRSISVNSGGLTFTRILLLSVVVVVVLLLLLLFYQLYPVPPVIL